MAGSRNPERIDRIVELLRRYWTEHPDLRLGQIVGNAADAMGSDPYYVEDEEVETDFRLQLSRLQPEAQPAGAVAEGVAIMERGIDPTTDPDEIARRKAAMDAAPFFPAQPAGAPEPPVPDCPDPEYCLVHRNAGEHP